MDLFKQLREESLKRRLPVTLILLALGAALFFAFSCYDLVKLAFPWKLSQLTPERMSDVWVEDDVTYLYREYAQEITHQEGAEDRQTGAAYVIGISGERYMGLYIHKDALPEFQALLEASNAAYTGTSATEDLPGLHIRGMVRPMEGKQLALYRAAAEGDESVESLMLPYYIDEGRIGRWQLWQCWTALAVSCTLMAAGLAVAVYTLAGGCQRKMKARAAQAGNLEMSMSRIERFYHRTPAIGGVRADKNYILFRKGAVDVLLRPWDVTWAYAIDHGNSSKVVLRTAQGKKYTVKMRAMDAQTLMQHLESETPGMLLGYNKERAYSYRCDPTFAHRWEAIWPGCTYKK